MSEVQIPNAAVGPGEDVALPTTQLLGCLNLLGTAEDFRAADGFKATFSGPPQSVAVIESGATAASKWWAAGLGTTVVATWGSVIAWWETQEAPIKASVIGGATLVTVALVLAIGYLLASDVRGRAAATVAIVNARAKVAEQMISAAQASYVPARPEDSIQLVALPAHLSVTNTMEPAANELGWKAIAIERQLDGRINYLIVKDSAHALVDADKLTFA